MKDAIEQVFFSFSLSLFLLFVTFFPKNSKMSFFSQDPSAPLRQDCAATRLVGCHLVVDGEDWFYACVKDAFRVIIDNPDTQFEEEELIKVFFFFFFFF